MKELSCYTSRASIVLSKQLQIAWQIAMVTVVIFLFMGNALAQTPGHPECTKPNGDPDPPQCTSQDLLVRDAFLTSSQCACTSESEIIADLNFKLFNKTGSVRTSFAVFAILVKESPDGTKESVYFKDCMGPVPPGEISTITFENAVTYECGQSLTLTDVYLAWTDASGGDNRLCDGPDGLLANFCKIDPKCGRPGDIVIRPLLTASVTDTDATCEGKFDGSITVTASGGTGPYDFILNPGNVTVNNDADGVYTFTGLAAGDYSIKVIDADNCDITVQGNVEELPNPSKPTVKVTDPTCEVLTGKIEVTSSTSGLMFSLDGSPFAAYPSGGWVVDAGTSHTLVAKNASGCVSDVVDIDIGDAPIVPSGIQADITDPTCTVATGTIEVKAPLGAIYSYSLDGTTYQSTTTFSGLAPGPYTLYVKSSDGCVSTQTGLVIGDAPIVPSGIQADITDPTCTVATGTIEVKAPLGAIYSYSLDGTTYQSTTTFSGLAPGPYTLYVKSSDGCVSTQTGLVIGDAPIVPSGIQVSPIQPTCEMAGSIEFVSPLGDFTYSIDGGSTYQDNPLYSGLNPATYVLSVKSDDGCVAAAGEITLVEPVCEIFEGCTLGYWKNHTDRWVSCGNVILTPSTKFKDVFSSANTGNMTLLQALNSKGGKLNNLYRQSVAAILNACHPDVNYELSASEVIAGVNSAISGGTAGTYATYLDGLNNAGCPLGGTRATSSSSLQGIDKAEGHALRAYPTPFSDKATIEFTTAVDENYSVRLYDMKGAMIKELKSGSAKAGVVNQIEVDGRNLPEGLYLARMVSDSGSKTVKLLLKK